MIQVSLAIVDAEREYYRRDPDKDSLLQYAQKLISTKGKRDGLYWETKPGEQPSPLGLLVAQARAEGYKGAGGKPVPYHGYYYKLLTGQAKTSRRRLRLSRARQNDGRFRVVAYPAQYGSSGIRPLTSRRRGSSKKTWEQNRVLAQSMTKFNRQDLTPVNRDRLPCAARADITLRPRTRLGDRNVALIAAKSRTVDPLLVPRR